MFLPNFEPESKEDVVTKLVARSFRYSWRVRIAIAVNFSDLCTAFSALMAATINGHITETIQHTTVLIQQGIQLHIA